MVPGQSNSFNRCRVECEGLRMEVGRVEVFDVQ